MMSFRVMYVQQANDDLERLTEALLSRAESADDLDRIEQVMGEVRGAIGGLENAAPRCRKSSDDPRFRELVIPSGGSGYLALFRIEAGAAIVSAVRHQREDDYH